MAAVTHNEPELESQPHMQVPLIFSVVLHAAIVVIAIVGLPYMTPELPEIVDPITVELVQVDEITQTHKPPPPEPSRQAKPKQDSEAPPKPVQPQMTAKTPPKPSPPKPPEPEKKEAQKPEPEPEAVAPPKQKPEPAKTIAPPKPVKRPPPPIKVEEAKQEEFKSLLRNLMPTEEQAVQADKPGEAEPSSMLTRFSQQMTMSEMDSLKRQLNQCWSVMAGARYAEDLIVDLNLFMNPDRSVRDVQILNVMRYNTDSFFRAAAEAARRAVFRCSPLDVPPGKYDLWKEIEVRFDPRKML